MAKQITLQHTELKALKMITKARDKNRCRVCKSTKMLASHHVIFRSDLGDDTAGNLCTLCVRCHKRVHGLIADDFLVICSPDGDHIVPDCDGPLRFKTYNNVRKRLRWRT
jgi:hypothetical protein